MADRAAEIRERVERVRMVLPQIKSLPGQGPIVLKQTCADLCSDIEYLLGELDGRPAGTASVSEPRRFICRSCQTGDHGWCEGPIIDPERGVISECVCDDPVHSSDDYSSASSKPSD